MLWFQLWLRIHIRSFDRLICNWNNWTEIISKWKQFKDLLHNQMFDLFVVVNVFSKLGSRSLLLWQIISDTNWVWFDEFLLVFNMLFLCGKQRKGGGLRELVSKCSQVNWFFFLNNSSLFHIPISKYIWTFINNILTPHN